MKIVLATCLFALSVTANLSAGLVVNGNFEAGCVGNDAPNWTAATVDGSGGCRTTGGNPAGSFILNSNGDPATDPTISQTLVGLVLGQTYTITLDYQIAFVGGSLTNAAGVSIDGHLFQFNLFNDSTWRTFTTNFVYGGGSAVLALTGERNGSDNAPRVDNVDVNPVVAGQVPEPGTFAMIGLGALVIGVLRRRLT